MNSLPSVLYVEDDAPSRRIMSMVLKGRMKLTNIHIWENSADFLTKIAALDPKPDIVFLDIHVAPYTGFQMLTMLREQPWTVNTPIVALTASVMNEEVQQLYKAGFHACLSKPIDIERFPDIFERILAGEAIWSIIA